MTIATTASVVTIQGNGITTSFNYSFLIPFLSDGVTPAAAVYYTATDGTRTLLAPSAYTISGVGISTGGTVVYNPGTPIVAHTYLSIVRTVPYTQPTSVPNQAFYPKTVEDIADAIELQIQQLVAIEAFSLRMPITDPTAPGELPAAAARANMVLGFDASGVVEMVDLNGIVSVINAHLTLLDGEVSTINAAAAALAIRVTTCESNITILQGDVVSINGSLSSINSAISTINITLTHLYRPPSAETTAVTELPIASARANKLFGFDSIGNPSMVTLGGSTGSTAIRNFFSDQTVVAGWAGNILVFDASGGNLICKIPRSLGASAAFQVTVERDPADTSSNLITIVDETNAVRALIISPNSDGLVPSLVCRVDGTYLTARGVG